MAVSARPASAAAARRLGTLLKHVCVPGARPPRPSRGLGPQPTAAAPALNRALQQSYDYVVVGAGSAGCVVASRLSEDPSVTVLLIEAGPDNQSFQVRSPFYSFGSLQNTDRDWAFRTVKQDNYDDRVSFWPRGKLLGGCSSINAMVYCRGDPRNYDHWAEKLGCKGWSYEEVLPFFKKSENLLGDGGADSEVHGRGGPLQVTQSSQCAFENKELCEQFVASCEAAGLPSRDINGRAQRGASLTQVTIKDGVRCDTASAFLYATGAMSRPNLTVLTEGMATRVAFSGSEATGVYVQGKQTSNAPRLIHASREVVLSCGAVGTPHLLMLSGVGPKAHLEEHGLECLCDLPVGENLQDHLMFGMGYGMKEGVPNPISAIRPLTGSLIPAVARHLLFGTGFLSLAPIQAVAFDHSGLEGLDEAEGNDMQIHYLGMGGKGADGEEMFGIPTREDRPLSEKWSPLKPWEGVTFLPTIVRPRSRGFVRLASSDPFAPPVIDPRYFSDPRDMEVCVAVAKLVRKVARAGPFVEALGKEVEDPSIPHAPESDEYLREFVRRTAVTVYHPTSTARMGAADDPGAVVDTRLRVRGLQRLRIADASVMPVIVSGNTNAPSIMIGERLAAFLQEERKLGAT